MGVVEVRILGPVDVVRGERVVELRSPRERALLALLALRVGHRAAIDELVDELWRVPPKTARKVVRIYAGRLAALLPGVVVRDGTGYRLTAGTDLARFEGVVRCAREADDPAAARNLFSAALRIWRGPALGGVGDEPFVVAARLRLDEARASAVVDRIDANLACGGHAEVLPELEALVADRPLDERARAQLMLALYRCGRQVDALEVYRSGRRELSALGIEPGEELRRIERAILRHDAELRTARHPGVRIPAAAAPLVGRTAELEAVLALVQDRGARLVTFTGPGGIGKTRLALEAARELAPSFADGATFVDLTVVVEPARAVETLANALGVRVRRNDSAENALIVQLRTRRHLLVLDSFEHLLAAAPMLGRLLAAAPGLVILVTSRAVLRLSGEHELLLEPLDPATDGTALFVQRSRIAFTDDAKSVAQEICRSVDGIPLAIELAAARTRFLPPGALLQRLAGRLDVLAGGPRDAPARQQTMRATIDWSYRLLGQRDRRVFAEFSVFVGGATLDAVMAVCGEATDGLASLVDWSLLRRVSDEPPRFAMLDTLREYAAEQLEGTGHADAVRRRHACWYLRLAEEAEPHLREAGQATWLERLEAEHDNLRAALAWSIGVRDGEIAASLAAALARFWYAHGYYAEGIECLTQTLELADVAPATRAKVLRGLGALADRVGREQEAIAWLQESFEISRAAGDGLAAARALLPLGHALASIGEPETAMSAAENSRRLFEAVGSKRGLAVAVNNQGAYALQLGDAEGARRLFAQAVPLAAEVGDKQTLALGLCNKAFALLELGDEPAAVEALEQSLEVCRELGFREVTAYVLEGLAALAVAQGREPQAARLAGAADALAEELHLRLEPYERRLHDRTRTAIRGPVARRRGRPRDVFRYALQVGMQAKFG